MLNLDTLHSFFLRKNAIQIERSTNTSHMRKSLRKIPKRLPLSTPPPKREKYLSRSRNLLTIQSQMIGISNHILEHKHRLCNKRFIVFPSPGKCFNQPECAHWEWTLATSYSVFGKKMVIYVRFEMERKGRVQRKTRPLDVRPPFSGGLRICFMVLMRRSSAGLMKNTKGMIRTAESSTSGLSKDWINV